MKQTLEDLGCTFDYFSRASLAMGEWLKFTVEPCPEQRERERERES